MVSMKKEGHPPYRDVLFVDTATGTKFVCGTTLDPKETEKFEGREYPVYRVPISSASHPFFTGSQQFVDSEGRVDKFRKRYARKEIKLQEQLAEEQPTTEKAMMKKGRAGASKKAVHKQSKMKKNASEK